MGAPATDRPPVRPGDLIAAHYLLARCDRHGVARTPFPERVEAARAGGFAGIGVQPLDYERSKASGLTDAAVASVLASNGLAMAEIDGAPWWPGEDGEAMARAQDGVLRLAERFGVPFLNAPMPTIDGDLPPDDAWAERLAALADRAGALGMRVGLEFLPWTPVRDVRHAHAVVRLADRPNLGVTVDVWHHSVSGCTADDLAAIPGDAIASIHVTDGVRDATLSPLAETTIGRRLPGEGELPVADVLAALWRTGARVPYSVEIVSLPHRHLPLTEWAVLAGTSVRRAVAEAATVE